MQKIEKFNKVEKKLLLLQRNELLSKKQFLLRKKLGRYLFTNYIINFFQLKNLEKKTFKLFEKEFLEIKKYLPSKALTIMDIGCGLGILNIFLNKYYNFPKFFLLDKNKVDKKIKYGHHEKYESYNFLNNTKNILLNNGINTKKLKLFDVEKKFLIPNKSIDLVISLKSMGYHYPINIYFHLLKKVCKNKTIYIFDISKKNQTVVKLKEIFKSVKIIREHKLKHPLIRVCCSGFFCV